MKKALIPLADGLEEMEAVIIADILRRAGIETTLAGVTGSPVTGSRGVRILPDCAWNDLQPMEFDALILPGGLNGVDALAADARVTSAVRDFNTAGKTLAAICAAPLALHAAGVLTGRRITSYPGTQDQLTDCQWVDERVVRDGNLITSQGPGTAIEFALALVEVMAGSAAAITLARGLVVS